MSACYKKKNKNLKLVYQKKKRKKKKEKSFTNKNNNETKFQTEVTFYAQKHTPGSSTEHTDNFANFNSAQMLV